MKIYKTASLNNRVQNHEPIFKSIFGKSWDRLPPVMHKHYANRSHTDDLVTVEGRLDVMHAGPVKLFRYVFLFLELVPPFTEKNVPVRVDFKSTRDSNAFQFNRCFIFKGKKIYNFKSRMLQISGSEVVELMRFGIGWRMDYLWQDNKVILKHKGYLLNVFGFLVPLPITWLLGRGHGEEVAVDEDSFKTRVDICHPWWGKIYEYKGQFKVITQV